MKLNNMGSKSNTEVHATPDSPDKDKVSYPHLSLSSAQFPELKDWKVGTEYHLHLVVKQVGMRESYKDEDEYDVDFEILKAGSMKGSKVSEDEYKKMSSEEKDDADESEVMDEDE